MSVQINEIHAYTAKYVTTLSARNSTLRCHAPVYGSRLIGHHQLPRSAMIGCVAGGTLALVNVMSQPNNFILAPSCRGGRNVAVSVCRSTHYHPPSSRG